MVSRLNRTLQFARDIPLILISLVLMSTSYGKWDPPTNESSSLLLFGIMAVFLAVTGVNLGYLIAKAEKRNYFMYNAAFQTFPSVILVVLVAPIGLPLLALNVAILTTLRKKKDAPRITEPTRSCPTCGTALIYAQKKKKWFCPRCKKPVKNERNPPGTQN